MGGVSHGSVFRGDTGAVHFNGDHFERHHFAGPNDAAGDQTGVHLNRVFSAYHANHALCNGHWTRCCLKYLDLDFAETQTANKFFYRGCRAFARELHRVEAGFVVERVRLGYAVTVEKLSCSTVELISINVNQGTAWFAHLVSFLSYSMFHRSWPSGSDGRDITLIRLRVSRRMSEPRANCKATNSQSVMRRFHWIITCHPRRVRSYRTHSGRKPTMRATAQNGRMLGGRRSS